MTRAILGTLLSFLALGCTSNASSIKASYCAAVSARHTVDRHEELALDKLVAEFATRNGLYLSGGEQVDTNEYSDPSRGILLDLTFGMGKFGSIVTLLYKGHAGDGVRAGFDKFLFQDVSKHFVVKRCSDIPGFQTPVMSDVVK